MLKAVFLSTAAAAGVLANAAVAADITLATAAAVVTGAVASLAPFHLVSTFTSHVSCSTCLLLVAVLLFWYCSARAFLPLLRVPAV